MTAARLTRVQDRQTVDVLDKAFRVDVLAERLRHFHAVNASGLIPSHAQTLKNAIDCLSDYAQDLVQRVTDRK